MWLDFPFGHINICDSLVHAGIKTALYPLAETGLLYFNWKNSLSALTEVLGETWSSHARLATSGTHFWCDFSLMTALIAHVSRSRCNAFVQVVCIISDWHGQCHLPRYVCDEAGSPLTRNAAVKNAAMQSSDSGTYVRSRERWKSQN